MSTTTKFTPGPWKIHSDTKSQHGMAWGGYWQIDGEYDAVACNQHCYANSDEDVSKANAALIAAAPCMYADLVEAERMFRWYGDLHAAKPDPEKAARNYEMADRLAATLAKVEAPRG